MPESAADHLVTLANTADEQKVIGELQRLTGCTSIENVLRVALWHLVKHYAIRVPAKIFEQR